MANTVLVRIKPSNNREVHTAHGVSIHKDRGWHEVPEHIGKALARERMNEMNPEASPPVFDVKSQQDAAELVERETLVAEPAGTVDRPRRVGIPEPETETAKVPAPAPVKKKKGKGKSEPGHEDTDLLGSGEDGETGSEESGSGSSDEK